MNYRKSELRFWILFGAGAVAGVFWSVFQLSWLRGLCILFVAAAVLQHVMFYRCPACKGHLGRFPLPNYCPYCGEKLK